VPYDRPSRLNRVGCCHPLGRRERLEAALAGTGESNERLVSELADLWFHSHALIGARDLDPAVVGPELERRIRPRTADSA
jgi:phosphoribosyl-ATP pyrophosphohydrolase